MKLMSDLVQSFDCDGLFCLQKPACLGVGRLSGPVNNAATVYQATQTRNLGVILDSSSHSLPYPICY